MGYNKPSQTSDEVVLSLNKCRRTPSPVARRPQREAIQTSTQRRELSSGRNSTRRSAPLTPLLKKISSQQMGKVQRTNAKKKGTNGADTLTHVSDDERNTPSPIRAPGETRHGDERRVHAPAHPSARSQARNVVSTSRGRARGVATPCTTKCWCMLTTRGKPPPIRARRCCRYPERECNKERPANKGAVLEPLRHRRPSPVYTPRTNARETKRQRFSLAQWRLHRVNDDAVPSVCVRMDFLEVEFQVASGKTGRATFEELA